jgi:hypothetical protein
MSGFCFTHRDELAETATAAVRHYLDAGEPEPALALQPFAAAAWRLTDPDVAITVVEDAYCEADRALYRLEAVCGAYAARRFLRDAIDFLHPQARRVLGDDPLPGRSLPQG